jgi:hypothetical protein
MPRPGVAMKVQSTATDAYESRPALLEELMRTRVTGYVTLALACTFAVPLLAQKMTETKKGGGGSPHVKSEWTVDGAAITIEYGRPFLKGRPEAQMMPPGEPWRTGADEATIITSSKPLTFGSVKLNANTPYTINTIPGDKEWQILFGTVGKPAQWGIPYQTALEIGKVTMTIGKPTKPVEQVTISIDDTADGATLRIEWGTASASVPFKVG